MNIVSIVGYFDEDPVIRVSPTGKKYVRFILAVPRNFINSEGKYEHDFISVMTWGKMAELVYKKARKGSNIAVYGRLTTRIYEKDGVKKYVTEVVVIEINFLESRKNNSSVNSIDV